ncbi:MAG TPA: sodium/proton antiporter NhaB, partial [Chromatiaceae bacterium]|nr:sodium/proton antiporter NhaB [Chromatiaceae bacterium]
NPLVLYTLGATTAGWLLIGEFIFTLAMALKCYPLQPGGLLAIEAAAIGLTDAQSIFHETANNFEVILLLIFMVAGIYFMKDLLLFVFANLLTKVRSKIGLSLLFCSLSAFLSAFLDALTVTAVLISVGVGFYTVFHKFASTASEHELESDHANDEHVPEFQREDLVAFRAFLRSLLMHGAVGTALGGVCTLVGEPQNLLIATKMNWSFVEFFIKMAPITMPVLVCGLMTCALLEKLKVFGYGTTLPQNVREVLADYAKEQNERRSTRQSAKLLIQAGVGIFLIIALATHVAAVGLVGLMVIVLLTAFNGVIDEHSIGKAFEEALPFTALLVVFFAIVAVIHDQHLFSPVINAVLAMDESIQPAMFFIANGVLSMISDNVFVATVYINEVAAAFEAGTISATQYNNLAIAINTGTNLPSVATPNGQAAFLFLLTSALAPLIRLSYGRMVLMALPYTFVLGGVGLAAVVLTL